ncbi:glycine betaine ABC transporter substrate-binding protein [Zooshikella harenae]|uniref:ABC transporter permease subunit n=1 Tax=Zooshikella harenae TaxID=2827238 RepID=A0ABS5ZFR8_9GAMM|nr:glycine betaine ABC transporter substrate-binding protein [Zooshikella harenae]MBU2712899.1 ABC transporter permease subunit [Zooshikella harenae]
MSRWLFFLIVGLLLPLQSIAKTVVVGSKAFNEGYLLGEIIAQKLAHDGFDVERKLGLGKTIITYEALKQGEIDVYVEYTGTLAQAILKLENTPSLKVLQQRAKKEGLKVLPRLGFNNTYALVISEQIAKQNNISSISDLVNHPDLSLGISHEFLKRKDGWQPLAAAYDLPYQPVGIEHSLAYQAIANEQIAITDAYTTDGDIARYQLRILKDDKQFFPRYDAVPLIRNDADPALINSLQALANRIDEAKMQQLNSQVVNDDQSFAEVAEQFLIDEALIKSKSSESQDLNSPWQLLPRYIVEHLQLTILALICSCLVGIPLSIAVYRQPKASRMLVYCTGLLQTIPSIALLALMIPLLGIGWIPAVVALFLYSLLPIVRNTLTALLTLDPVMQQVAVGMGLTPREQLRHVYIPLAVPMIFSGIRTAAIINIGTATLAAFIGAGGLGEPIVMGLSLNDTTLVLFGAVPAALLAIFTEWLFEGVERRFIPAHLRNTLS